MVPEYDTGDLCGGGNFDCGQFPSVNRFEISKLKKYKKAPEGAFFVAD
jgi:hypothetical protein